MAHIRPVRLLSRGKNYQLYFYNLKGERRRISAGNNYTIAQKTALLITECLYEGKDPGKLKHIKGKNACSKTSIKSFLPIFMERHAQMRSSSMQLSYKYSYSNIALLSDIAIIPMEEVTIQMVIEYFNKRINVTKVTPATANREGAFLKVLFSKAYEWNYIENNILKNLRLLPETGKRAVFLSREDAMLLLKNLPHSIANIVEFALYTGFRKRNILDLEIDSIISTCSSDVWKIELVVKGNRKIIFPVGPAAVKVLRDAIGERKTGYVFLNPQTDTRYISINRTFDRAVKKLNLKAGNTKLRFNDLRHLFASWLHREGVSLDQLRYLLGHKQRSTTDRYVSVDVLESGVLLNKIPSLREY
ncbi:MAG: site-specific integrase [bacterium]|nr:site-specific integrase [bacterium]